MLAADYAWGYNSAVPGALQARGVGIAARYLSYDPSKDLTTGERDALHAAGIATVLVWETTATRTEGGYAAGQSDATEALRRARELGMPEGRPIYFAVDEGTTVGPNITGYFQACRDVLGLPRVGAYGSFYIVEALHAAGLATWLWQTSAWSDGQVSDKCHLYQYIYNVSLGGVSADLNDVRAGDVGQWNLSAPLPVPTGSDPLMAVLEGLAFDGSYSFTHADNVRVEALQLFLAQAGAWIAPHEKELVRPWPARYQNLRDTLGAFQGATKTGNPDGSPDYVVGPATAAALCKQTRVF